MSCSHMDVCFTAVSFQGLVFNHFRIANFHWLKYTPAFSFAFITNVHFSAHVWTVLLSIHSFWWKYNSGCFGGLHLAYPFSIFEVFLTILSCCKSWTSEIFSFLCCMVIFDKEICHNRNFNIYREIKTE